MSVHETSEPTPVADAARRDRKALERVAARAQVAHLVAAHRLLVCVGSGGVGKTTAAAALGLCAAQRGRRTAVLTIDPARRLKDALGIATLDGTPHRVPLGRLRTPTSGTLDAMILDAKRTFDDLIRRYAPSEAAAERVLANRIYQNISTTLAGSQEYMAMERLYAIATERHYDLLIVDTPPTRHALDFLQAPERLTALLTSRAAAILQNPTLILSRESSRLAQMALAALLRGLERFTGFELLRDVAEFVGGIETLSAGFRSRAAEVADMLRRHDTTFLLVTTPEPARVAETLAFQRELARAGLPFGGFVINRVLPAALLEEDLPDPERTEHDAGLARKLVAMHRRLIALLRGERAQIARLERAAGDAPIVEIPLQTEEPTSLPALAQIAAALGG